jgi:drug/metabolite transporter (DMT)-like permease
LSEDREDSVRLVEGDPPPLLKRLLFGAIAGVVVMVLGGGLFGTSVSIREGILGTLAAGCTFGVITVVVGPWAAPDRFKEFCVGSIAGAAAGTAGWLIAQPSSPLILTIGSGVLLGALLSLFG